VIFEADFALSSRLNLLILSIAQGMEKQTLPMDDLTLAVETSGRVGSVALCRNGLCLEERYLDQTGRRHAQTLVVEVDSLFRKFGVSSSDCRLVAVSIGPGSFTGLRVGVVFAKTFAYATECQMVAVDTLHSIASASPSDVKEVYAVSDAGRSELYVGHYRRQQNDNWQRLGSIAIFDAVQWCDARSVDDVVTGPGVERVIELFAGRGRVLAPEIRKPRALYVARLGQRNLALGQCNDLWNLEPFYLRKSAAEEKFEQQHVDCDSSHLSDHCP